MANKKRTNKSQCDSSKFIKPQDILEEITPTEDSIETIEQIIEQFEDECNNHKNCCGSCYCNCYKDMEQETTYDQPDNYDSDTCDNANRITARGLDFSRRLLIELGINPDMKGYDYIYIGIELCANHAVKDVFSAIANFAGTTKGVVSSAIGAAFKKVEPARFDYFWEKYDIAPFEKLPAYEVLVNLLAVIAIENGSDYETFTYGAESTTID